MRMIANVFASYYRSHVPGKHPFIKGISGGDVYGSRFGRADTFDFLS